jgi:bacteriorhodopsin
MYEYSFYVVYILLLTTGTITFIEALRTKDQTVRNVLNLETCISIVAAYFYSLFIARMTAGDREDVIHLRYVDWSVTTPMLLLSLILTTLYSTGGGLIHLSDFLITMVLHYGMLLFGYLGEAGHMDKLMANLIGFLFFTGLFGFLYRTYMKKYTLTSMVLFITYVVVWGLYGIVYFFPTDEKMLGYNVLDLISKCFVGLFLWAYFAKVVVL